VQQHNGAFVPAAPLRGGSVDAVELRDRVQHVVLLMLENRSFDHMLGFLEHPYPDDFGQADLVTRYNVGSTGSHYAQPGAAPNLVDPDHSHAGILEQMGPSGGVEAMGGFVRNYESRRGAVDGHEVMHCIQPEVGCPVLASLAKEFAVCTRWFSSVPGETWPNRNFAHAATSDRSVNIEVGFYVDTTIFERLEKAKAGWHIYFDGPPEVWFFRRLWQPRLRDLLPKGKPRLANWFAMDQFFAHVDAESLPAYSFIEPAHNHYFEDKDHPRQTNSQHCHNNFEDPSAADFNAGEALIARVYDALVSKPDLFKKTLLVITYDEHGGLYDHVSPPKAVDPEDKGNVGFVRRIGRLVRKIADWRHHAPTDEYVSFDRLGVRVPAVLVSPWIQPGRTVPDQLEHASIPATLRARFAPDAAPLTKRDERAATFHEVVADQQALAVPREVAGGPPSVPPLKRSAEFLPTRAAATRRVDASPPTSRDNLTPTALDYRLASAGARMAEDLKRSRKRGVLRVAARMQPAAPPSAPAEREVAAGAARGPRGVPASVDRASPLDVFLESARAARRS
jgi:phospholipase C